MASRHDFVNPPKVSVINKIRKAVAEAEPLIDVDIAKPSLNRISQLSLSLSLFLSAFFVLQIGFFVVDNPFGGIVVGLLFSYLPVKWGIELFPEDLGADIEALAVYNRAEGAFRVFKGHIWIWWVFLTSLVWGLFYITVFN